MLESVTSIDDAKWGFERLAPFKTFSVGSNVPQGFERYDRILHPGWRVEGQRRVPVRWDEMAAYTGGHAHALMYWEDVATPSMGGNEVERPDEGTIPPEMALPLLDLLSRHMRNSGRDPCWVGVWSGWGHDYQEQVPQPTASFDTGAREWDLFRAPLAEAFLPLFDQYLELTANLIWDADRQWWLTTDIDLDSTYIGGSERLIAALLNSDELEAWPVAAEDGISAPDPLNPTSHGNDATSRLASEGASKPWQRWWQRAKLSLPEWRFHPAQKPGFFIEAKRGRKR